LASNSKPRASTDGRVDTPHHHYRIVAGRLNGSCRAFAYLGRRRFDEVEADTVEGAVEAMKRTLDDHRTALQRERTDAIPTDHEYREALTALEAELPARVFSILNAHSRHADAVATIRDLTRFGVGDGETVIQEYGRLGRKLALILGFAPKHPDADRFSAPIQSFAFIEASEEGAPFRLRLRPQVVAALGQPSHPDQGAGPAATPSAPERDARQP